MSVDSTIIKQELVMDGQTKSFNFTFAALSSEPESIKANVINVTGTSSTLTYDIDYTVLVNASGSGGVITVVDAQSASDKLFVYRQTTDKQDSDYADFNQFPADTVEHDFDRRTLRSQEADDGVSRAVKFPISSSISDINLPIPVDQFGLKWSGTDGTLVNTLFPPDSAPSIAISAMTISMSAATTSSVAATAAGISAAEAAASAIVATTQATFAASSATAAAASVAFIPLPTTGTVGQQLRVAIDNELYELFTPTDVDLSNTYTIAASGGDYTTIQAALTAIPTADTLFLVAPGTYVDDTIAFTANNQYILGIAQVKPAAATITKATNIVDYGAFTGCIIKDVKMVMTLAADAQDSTVKGSGSCNFKFCHVECVASGDIGVGSGATCFLGSGTVKMVEGSIVYTNGANRVSRGKKAILVQTGNYFLDDVTCTVTGASSSSSIAFARDNSTGFLSIDKCDIDVTDNDSKKTYGLNIDAGDGSPEIYYNSIHVENSNYDATCVRAGSSTSLSARSMFNHYHAVAGSGTAYFLEIDDANTTVVSQFDDYIAADGMLNSGGTYTYVNSPSDGSLEASGCVVSSCLTTGTLTVTTSATIAVLTVTGTMDAAALTAGTLVVTTSATIGVGSNTLNFSHDTDGVISTSSGGLNFIPNNANITFKSNYASLNFGDSDLLKIRTHEANMKGLQILLNASQRKFAIGDVANQAKDFDWDVNPDNPTLRVYSATNADSDNTQWMSLAHDGTDGTIDMGLGTIKIPTTSITSATITLLTVGTLTIDGALVNPDISKGITIENAVSGDDIAIVKVPSAATITAMYAVLNGGTSPSALWLIKHGTDRQSGSPVNTAGTTTTDITTGDTVTVFSDATIVANSWVWAYIPTVTGTVGTLNITVNYRMDA